jgi:hypothetical protein
MSKIVMLGFLLVVLYGCVDVGGSNVGVCTGTECGDGHNDSSDNTDTYGEGSSTTVTESN